MVQAKKQILRFAQNDKVKWVGKSKASRRAMSRI
jgi:hypothetical protein